MSHARIWARVKLDVTGNLIRLPIILTLKDHQPAPLEALLRFFLVRHHDRSHSWMVKLCEIVGQLIDYIEVNYLLKKPVHLFEGFVGALYNGTFDENGDDPSGLSWLPSNSSTINPKLHMLEEFSDWMVLKGYVTTPLNPWTTATNAEQRLNWIAWYRQNQYSFLGHLGQTGKNADEIKQARMIKLRRQPAGNKSAPKAFPANFEVALLRHGFVRPGKEKEKDILKKFDWRGICIAMLLMFGAKRLSEPFHLWNGDVMENPTRPGEALVRIYHPVEGQAPAHPTINGRRAPNRQAYLRTFFPAYSPRTGAHGNYRAGFKGRKMTDDRAKFIQVFWLPSNMASAFLWAFHNYMHQRASLGLDASKHPFAFVSHSGEHKGNPYTISSFERAWERAVKRIGLPHAKCYGTTPHGGRHGAGNRANKAGLSPYDARELFAHSSLESQKVYRVPTPEQVTDSMEAATNRIEGRSGAAENGERPINEISGWADLWQIDDEWETYRGKGKFQQKK